MANEIFENGMIIFIVIAAMVSLVKNPNCSIALLFSLTMGLYFSSVGSFYLHYHMMFFCIFMCVFEVRDGTIVLLDQSENEISYAVAFLYVPRMIVGALMLRGWIGLEAAWVASTILLFIQGMLVISGAFNGTGERVNSGIADFRNNLSDGIFHKARLRFE